MIKRYTDHSANERTYLAWVRTAIAVMAFGFMVEKFDLFLTYLGKAVGHNGLPQPSIAVETVGIGLFLVGVLIILAATLRFFTIKRLIEQEADFGYGIRLANILLSVLMGGVGLFLLVYLGHQFR